LGEWRLPVLAEQGQTAVWAQPHMGTKEAVVQAQLLSSAQAGFRFQNSPSNSTMQKKDSPSHQNTGIYMEY
jgi:hypothetical protein